MGVASSTSMMSKNSKATSVTSTSFLVLLLSFHVSSNPLPSNIFFPDTVVCLTTTATPQDFILADPNCRVFWQCRWDGSTSVHTAVMGECSEGEVFRAWAVLKEFAERKERVFYLEPQTCEKIDEINWNPF